MFCWIPNFWVRAFTKFDVKQGSLSEMILSGSPNHWYTFSKYRRATPSPVMVVEHGRNRAAQVHPWSTIVKMALCPSLLGSAVIRSMAMTWKGSTFEGTGILYKGTRERCVSILSCWHIAHPFT
jgi:hypothetical protein